ncbi:MAG: arylsulfatase [Prevotella sp.]|nr:arylsulfatase [Prevotella sp.]
MPTQKTSFLPFAALASLPSLAQGQQPNVIIILADDLGYGDVSAYGQTSVSTPNIDRLAEGGVSFTDGHATSATSTPSRYGLFTGMYPWKNEDAKILPGDAPLLISPSQFTMPKMFQRAGYRTAAIGKWHLGMGYGKIDWNKPIEPAGNAIGFDYTCLIAATVDRVPTVYVENGCVVGLDPSDPIYVDYEHNFPGEPTALTHPELVRMQWCHGHQNTIVNGIPRIGYMKGGHAARWKDEEMAQYFLDRVEHFLDTTATDRPFFLYYGLHEPHVPRTPDTRFRGATQLGPRGDVVAEADWCVGQLVKKLEEKGLMDNTLIIFSSDNGPVLDDGYDDGSRESRPAHDPNGGLRGGKYSLFDAGTRVPFFIYWQGHIQPAVNRNLVSQQDLLASLAKLIGQHVPDNLDSEEMLGVFMGKQNGGRKSMIVEASGRLAYRKGQYALVPPYHGPATNETDNELGVVSDFTLYDLEADPSQTRDITKERPELVEKLKQEFLETTQGYYSPDTEQETLK